MPVLSKDYKGLDLQRMALQLNRAFGFASEWQASSDTEEGCYEFDGRIVIDLAVIDQICEQMYTTKADAAQVFRYILSHLKAHHFQELYPTYDKPYIEDVRPYEIEADLLAGWLCANARIPDLFRTHGMPGAFRDFHRLKLMGAKTPPNGQFQYPWPEEKDFAFRRGARMWAAGRVSEYNSAATKQGMEDETFAEFLAGVPMVVKGLALRPVPRTEIQSATGAGGYSENRIPVSSGPRSDKG